MTAYTLIPATNADLSALPFHGRHLINGSWCDSAESFERRSPAHGCLVSRHAKAGAAETTAAIEAARLSFDAGDWSRASGKERATLLLKVADLIAERSAEMALLEALETGKPITQARGEVSGAADLWRYAAALARALHGDSHDSLGPDLLAMVLQQPVGVVSIITPWNFPFWILSQKLPFALAAGCSCIVKPSEITPSTTVILGELLTEAGLPPGVVNIVLGYGDPVGALMAAHPMVDMVSFTGSTTVGRSIQAAASATLKKLALELGGKNPQVVLPDADLDAAADAVVFGSLFNAGECCNAGSRLILHRDIAADFTARLAELSARVAFGDPLDPQTQVGAIISPAHLQRIDRSVKDGLAAGAGLALGGETLQIPGLSGTFYAPTLLTGIRPDMAIAREEVFGPVLAIQSCSSLDEAISLANDTSYGLSAGIWSKDIHACLRFARSVEAGTIWTNSWMDGFPEVPFGGMKQSGLGRENGHYGLEEYLEPKSVVMRIGASTRAPWVRR
ncbi:aldehyde dehydrogenase family protein [Pseudogemmobacter faecipullorum]|uniref:Aldehyde dehydrogenase family protein n=1 Tax=Pseudogemmobacter faecipullorum TaxID=2755041 RepID=A0ABS8CPQ5_9RHOB|nr:aldehyde dehydrogenase family protein [Pseudogemmobacter faecipullorum]MCB5411370.1 aldehyde dehydrogenase family protein [Pseudogemmobacter faecipullorum]